MSENIERVSSYLNTDYENKEEYLSLRSDLFEIQAVVEQSIISDGKFKMHIESQIEAPNTAELLVSN